MTGFYARIPRTRGTRTKEGVSQKKKFKQEREKAESCGSKWEPQSWWARTGRKDWAQPRWGLGGALAVLTAILLWAQHPKDAENAESFRYAPSLIQPEPDSSQALLCSRLHRTQIPSWRARVPVWQGNAPLSQIAISGASRRVTSGYHVRSSWIPTGCFDPTGIVWGSSIYFFFFLGIWGILSDK